MDFSLLTIKIYIENWLGGLAANWTMRRLFCHLCCTAQ